MGCQLCVTVGITTGDGHQREFQDIHGKFPELLQDFLSSDARWEVRLCAWLLWLMKSGADPEGTLHRSSPWTSYIQTLPRLDNLSTLLSYSPLEQRALVIRKCASATCTPSWLLSWEMLSADFTAGTSENLKFSEMWHRCSITLTFMV